MIALESNLDDVRRDLANARSIHEHEFRASVYLAFGILSEAVEAGHESAVRDRSGRSQEAIEFWDVRFLSKAEAEGKVGVNPDKGGWYWRFQEFGATIPPRTKPAGSRPMRFVRDGATVWTRYAGPFVLEPRPIHAEALEENLPEVVGLLDASLNPFRTG